MSKVELCTCHNVILRHKGRAVWQTVGTDIRLKIHTKTIVYGRGEIVDCDVGHITCSLDVTDCRILIG
jgi:hypothetical protein